MKTSTSNNPHMARGAVRSHGYRPLGENVSKSYGDKHYHRCNPFAIPLVDHSKQPNYRYIPSSERGRKPLGLNKQVSHMLGMGIGQTMHIYSPEDVVSQLIAKCKKLCPNGAFEIIESTSVYTLIKCTAV